MLSYSAIASASASILLTASFSYRFEIKSQKTVINHFTPKIWLLILPSSC